MKKNDEIIKPISFKNRSKENLEENIVGDKAFPRQLNKETEKHPENSKIFLGKKEFKKSVENLKDKQKKSEEQKLNNKKEILKSNEELKKKKEEKSEDEKEGMEEICSNRKLSSKSLEKEFLGEVKEKDELFSSLKKNDKSINVENKEGNENIKDNEKISGVVGGIGVGKDGIGNKVGISGGKGAFIRNDSKKEDDENQIKNSELNRKISIKEKLKKFEIKKNEQKNINNDEKISTEPKENKTNFTINSPHPFSPKIQGNEGEFQRPGSIKLKKNNFQSPPLKENEKHIIDTNKVTNNNSKDQHDNKQPEIKKSSFVFRNVKKDENIKNNFLTQKEEEKSIKPPANFEKKSFYESKMPKDPVSQTPLLPSVKDIKNNFHPPKPSRPETLPNYVVPPQKPQVPPNKPFTEAKKPKPNPPSSPSNNPISKNFKSESESFIKKTPPGLKSIPPPAFKAK